MLLWLLVSWLIRILFNFQSSTKVITLLNSLQIILSRLLSAVHRPWNSYCIQLDSKSSPEFHQLIQKLVNCYNYHYGNTSVILSPHQTSLVWQHSSLLEGDLNCLELLLKERSNWKYYINIVGSEYPIITNFQLIQNLNKVEIIDFSFQ